MKSIEFHFSRLMIVSVCGWIQTHRRARGSASEIRPRTEFDCSQTVTCSSCPTLEALFTLWTDSGKLHCPFRFRIVHDPTEFQAVIPDDISLEALRAEASSFYPLPLSHYGLAPQNGLGPLLQPTPNVIAFHAPSSSSFRIFVPPDFLPKDVDITERPQMPPPSLIPATVQGR